MESHSQSPSPITGRCLRPFTEKEGLEDTNSEPDMSTCGIQPINGKLFWLSEILFVLLLALRGCCSEAKGFERNLESFFCSVDQDGDGEIEQHEATKFLALVGGKLDLSAEDFRDDNTGTKDGLNDFFFSHTFDFSYGGTTICAEEMLDHLQNMLTADRVVDWITHGLQLPQYAGSFRQNAVNGLDFPALIEKESWTLKEELGVQSALHRIKITHALVRQIFGLGASPGPLQEAHCEPASCDAILLHWKPPLSKGYPPLHKYIVQRWDNGTSSWLSIVNDTKENSFLDKNGLYPARNYSYRVQAWGSHGPSEWVVMHGCHALDSQFSSGLCNLEPGSDMDSTTTSTHIIGDMVHSFKFDAASSNFLLSDSKASIKEGQTRPKASWGWVYSLNGGLVVLGILSRNSCFFRLTLAAWVVFRIKVLGGIHFKLVEAQGSQYALVRKFACGFVSAFACWNYLHAKVWFLSMRLSKSTSPPSLESKFFSHSDSYRDALGFSAADCSFEEMVAAIHRPKNLKSFSDSATNMEEETDWGSSFNRENNDVIHREVMKQVSSTTKSKLAVSQSQQVMSTVAIREQSSSGLGFSKTNSKGQFDPRSQSAPARVGRVNAILTTSEMECEVDTGEESKRFSSSSRHHGSSLVRNRYMCNFEGCKSRFDRLFSLSAWRMKFSKHYCRECQLVYCVKHTRISPHGPFGQCGLDSNCVCLNCFKSLSSETRQKLERVNKLRVGPPAGSISLTRKDLKRKDAIKTDSVTLMGHGVHSNSHSADIYQPQSLPHGVAENVQENCEPLDTSTEGPFPSNLKFLSEGESSDGTASSECSRSSSLTISHSRQTSSISSGNADDSSIVNMGVHHPQ